MCGIVGVVAKNQVNQLLYDGLLVLQHRGQDAAGIVTAEGSNFRTHKGPGMVRDVFRTRNMRALTGTAGIAHTRYPTAGSAWSAAEAQPFYVNSPFGIVLGHNGNLTNTEQLKNDLFRQDMRHVNTNSDSEVLLNVLAHELQEAATNYKLDPATIFAAVSGVYRRCRGAYAVVAMIAGYGVLAVRDAYGIRPLVFGRAETDQGDEYMVASESVALDSLGAEPLSPPEDPKAGPRIGTVIRHSDKEYIGRIEAAYHFSAAAHAGQSVNRSLRVVHRGSQIVLTVVSTGLVGAAALGAPAALWTFASLLGLRLAYYGGLGVYYWKLGCRGFASSPTLLTWLRCSMSITSSTDS